MPFPLMELNTSLQAAAYLLATRKSSLFDATMTNWCNWTSRDLRGNLSLDRAVTVQQTNGLTDSRSYDLTEKTRQLALIDVTMTNL